MGVRWAVAGCLLFLGAGAAVADDEKPAAPLETRVFQVGALTTPRTGFRGERGPEPARPDDVSDENRPLFPVEDYETQRRPDGGQNAIDPAPYAGMDELVERIKSSSAQGTWEQEGASIAPMGSRLLVVRAPASVQRDVAGLLAAFERDALATVVVDVMALGGEGALEPDGVAAGVASRSVEVLAAARASAWLGVSAVGTSGSMTTFLQDHDVEVAQKSQTTDPTVGLEKAGLSFQAHAVRSGDRLLARVDAWHAKSAGRRSVKTATGETVELPDVRGSELHATMRLVPGAWALATGAGGVRFAVRASVEEAAIAPDASGPLPVAARSGAPGPFALATVPAADLFSASEFGARLRPIFLAPSNFTPREMLEIPQPEPVVGCDGLLELVKNADPGAWEEEGSSLQVVPGRVLVRHDEARRAAVEKTVAVLRDRFARGFRLRATVVTVPAGAWVRPLAAGELEPLLADDGRGLLATDGAKVVGRASLRLLSGQRSAATSGTWRSYVGDYDVEIAQESSIGNPIVQRVLDGMSLDLWAHAASGGGALALEARLDRSTWRGSRNVPTAHGEIECPDMTVLRLRGQRAVALGSTVVLAAGVDGPEATLVLLSVAKD
jgi:hypothetical protein